MVNFNRVLYSYGEIFDYCVVIKYVFYVGDSKRVMDEYMFEIMMGGINILVIYNMCEDLLLVSFFIIDFIVLVELCEWI